MEGGGEGEDVVMLYTHEEMRKRKLTQIGMPRVRILPRISASSGRALSANAPTGFLPSMGTRQESGFSSAP